MEMIKTQDLAFTYPGTEDQVNTLSLIHISEPTRRS